jgi:hypothetical protein
MANGVQDLCGFRLEKKVPADVLGRRPAVMSLVTAGNLLVVAVESAAQ